MGHLQNWLIAALVILGVALARLCQKKAAGSGTALDIQWAQNMVNVVIGLGLVVGLVWLRRTAAPAPLAVWKWVWLASIPGTVAALLSLFWLTRADVTVVVTISAAFPALVYLLAMMFLGETFNGTRLAGVFCVALGVYLVGVSK